MVASPISSTLQHQQGQQETLSRCLEDAINSLSAEQLYNHPSHNFKQSGDRLRGGCPFHQTKSGSSFVVTISSKLFWCAGCQFGGSPADYRVSLKAGRWVKARGRDFVEIVRELAADANVPFPKRESSPEEIARAQKWERRRAVLAATQEYCQEALWNDTEAALEARHYLVAERGLTEEEIKLLPIGYYPSAGELKQHLISKGFSDEDWKGTGCMWKDMERYITFMWNDASGRPLTIYGRYFRQHPPDGKPKTIASPGEKTKQSPLYFDRALKARHKEIVLVEGVLDAVLLQAKGDSRVCAYVAANCSGDQIETLKRRGIAKVTLCGDPDKAGEGGTNSNLLRLTEAGISVYAAPKLPDGLDPDEFLIREGMEGWKAHVDAATHGFRWKAQRLIESGDTSTDKGKAEVLQAAIAFCKAVKNHPDLDVFFWPAVRSSLGMEPEDLRQQLERLWESSPAEVVELDGGSGSDGGDGGDRSKQNGSVTGDSRVSGDSQDSDTMSVAATVTTVTAILKKGFPDWMEINKLEEVKAKSELKDKAFYALVNGLKAQFDEVQPEDEVKLRALINWHNAELDFHSFLPSMASDILHDAKILNIDPIGIWQYLLPTLLSLAGKRVHLDVESHIIPAIIWTVLLAESGSGKTRAKNLVIKPLEELQHQAEERFKAELAEWEETISNWEEGDGAKPPRPVERKYLFEVGTIQAVMRRQSEQGMNGSVWVRDELVGLFQSLKQFDQKENEALSCLIEGWDGGSVSVARVKQEDSYSIKNPRLSITGGLQPGVFKKAFQDPDDSQGLQARFLFAQMKPQKPKRTKGFCYLSGKLPAMYQWMDSLAEGKIKLSIEADRYYDKLYEAIGEQAFNTSMPAIRAWMFKLPAQLLRIALGLHLIECYHDQNRPLYTLQKDTLERAVLVAQYYRSAFHIVQTTAAKTDDLSAILLQIWDKATTRHPDGISVRDAYRDIKAIQYRAKDAGRPVAAYTAELFSKLAEMGKGTVVQNGRLIKFVANLTPPPIKPDGDGEPKPEITHPGDRVTAAENIDISTLEVSPESGLSLVTLPINEAVDVLQNEAHEEVRGAIAPIPVEQMDYTSADVPQEAIAPTTPVEKAPQPKAIGAYEETPQLLQQGTVEAAPTAMEEGYSVINADADGWGELVCEEEAIAPTTPVQNRPEVEVKEQTAAASKAVPSTQPRQLPPVGARIEPLDGEYKGLVCVVQSVTVKNNIIWIWAKPEGKPQKPEYGYLSGDYKILPATSAPAAAIEESPEVKELPTVMETPQPITAKPTTEATTVVEADDDQWKEGDRVVVDATELFNDLKRFDGRQGVVTKVKKSSAQCLVDFGGDEFMHVPFRGLTRG